MRGFFPSTERFYHAAHPNGHKSSSAAVSGGMTRCPFRAALQSKKSLHTSSATSVPPAVQTRTQGEEEAKRMERRNETNVNDEGHRCKCVVDGLAPKGVCMYRKSGNIRC